MFLENLDFEKLIEKYDSETTFFYIDPPYYMKEKLYKRDGVEGFVGHDKLAEILKNIKGKFLLSYNDVLHIRDLYDFKGINIEKITSTYTMSGRQTTASELLIRNYSLKETQNVK